MTNLVNNWLYIKNTGPEFNALKALFMKDGLSFGKFHPIPYELDIQMSEVDLLTLKANLLEKRANYWNPKVNWVIKKLNSLGFDLPIIQEFNYSDFEKIMSDGLAENRASIRKRIRNFLRHRQEKKNIKKFGAKDRDEWCVINWGTKWDAFSVKQIYSSADEYCVEFKTLIDIPEGIYKKLGLDFPNCAMMRFNRDFKKDFTICASRNPSQEWKTEELIGVFTKDYEFLSLHPKPSKDFYEFAKQFKTPLPDWFIESQRYYPSTLKNQTAV